MKDRKGLTIIEILIVIVIMAIILTIAGLKSAQQHERMQEVATMANIQRLKAAIENYREHEGRWPHDLQALIPEYLRKIPEARLGRHLLRQQVPGTSAVYTSDMLVSRRYIITAKELSENQHASHTICTSMGGWVYSTPTGLIRVNCSMFDRFGDSRGRRYWYYGVEVE